MDVVLIRLLGVVDLPAAEHDSVYVATDFLARVRSGTPTAPTAGSDVTDARWVTANELTGLPTTPGLVETLAGWGVP